MAFVRRNNKEIMHVPTNIAALRLIICTTATADFRICLNYIVTDTVKSWVWCLHDRTKLPLYYSLQPNTEKARLNFKTYDTWDNSLEEIQHMYDIKTK